MKIYNLKKKFLNERAKKYLGQRAFVAVVLQGNRKLKKYFQHYGGDGLISFST